MTLPTLPTLPPPLGAAGAHIAHHIARTATDLPTRKGMTFVWAGNGLFTHAWNGTTRALVPVCVACTPGLGELHPFISWRGWPHRLPAALFGKVLADALARYRPEAPTERQWFIILRDGVPVLVTPDQESSRQHVSYQMPEGRVLADIHSHHGMPPFFSGTDDADDTGLGLSVVIGRLGSPSPSAVARITCYGQHHDLDLASLVTGEIRAGALTLMSERDARRQEAGPFSSAFDAGEEPTSRAFDTQTALRGDDKEPHEPDPETLTLP